MDPNIEEGAICHKRTLSGINDYLTLLIVGAKEKKIIEKPQELDINNL